MWLFQEDGAFRSALQCAAHHEAAHGVVAAVQGLDLRPDGIRIDDFARGMTFYDCFPADNDGSCESVILASEAGWWGQSRYVSEQESGGGEGEPPHLEDHDLSWAAMRKLAPGHLKGESHKNFYLQLRTRSKSLVAQHWPAIKAVAKEVLAQEPQPVGLLSTGERWTTSTGDEIRLGGEAIVKILSQFSVGAVCRPRAASVKA